MLEVMLGVALPATLVFDYPSVEAIAEFLHSEGHSPPDPQSTLASSSSHHSLTLAMIPSSAKTESPSQAQRGLPLSASELAYAPRMSAGRAPPGLLIVPSPSIRESAVSTMIAITASCHMAPTPNRSLQAGCGPAIAPASSHVNHLTHSASSIQPGFTSRLVGDSMNVISDSSSVPPLSRWDVKLETTLVSAGDGLPARFGSFLEGVDEFDAGAFGLSRAEAVLMGELWCIYNMYDANLEPEEGIPFVPLTSKRS